MEDLRDAQIDEYIKLIKEGANIVYLVSDSISTAKVKPLQEAFPERVINAGIAEQDLLGIAAGMANGGFIPVTGNAAPFLISRSNEQLKVDISYSNSNVKVTGLHAGFSYGKDGITHHEVNDISVVRGFPNFEIYAPCDPEEARQIARYAVLERTGPVYMSLCDAAKYPVVTGADYRFIPGEPIQFSEGKDLTVVALGVAIHDVLAAQNGAGHVSADVFAVSSIRPLKTDKLFDSIKKTGRVLTVEMHSTHGGLGSLTAELIAGQGLGAKLKRLGVPEGHFSLNATPAANKAAFGLDAAGIAKAVAEILR